MSPRDHSKPECVCGRNLHRTRNPKQLFPPHAIVKCLSRGCGKQIIVGRNTFYCCSARSKRHGTKDGTYVLCVACADARLKGNGPKVVRRGFMSKKGVAWNRAYRRRYFELMADKRLRYFKEFKDGVAVDEKGVADLREVERVQKKSEKGLTVATPSREWVFLCDSAEDRDAWYEAFMAL